MQKRCFAQLRELPAGYACAIGGLRAPDDAVRQAGELGHRIRPPPPVTPERRQRRRRGGRRGVRRRGIRGVLRACLRDGTKTPTTTMATTSQKRSVTKAEPQREQGMGSAASVLLGIVD